jgi:hypothetical protein
MTAMSSNHFLPLGAALILGCCCLTNAWAGKVPPKNASDYGSSSSQNTECSVPTVDQNGVTATCFTGSGSFPDSFLFNFTIDSPSNQTSSFSVTSFTAFEPGGLSDFSDFALLGGCSSNSSTGDPVPCDPNAPATLPFDVNGSLAGSTFTFTGFTGDQTGNVTVLFDCASSNCSEPLITNITAGPTTTTTPEPRFYAFLTLAILLGAGLFRRASFSL